MTEETPRPRSNVITIILTGFVSLAVGVGSGLLINYLTEKRPKLTYDITTQEVFSGQQNNIGIFALRIVNDGKREIEQVTCHLWFSEGKLTERRVVGIPDTARSVGGSERDIEVTVPFLNPGEQFSIPVLLSEVRQPLARPSIEIRGKGVLGAEVSSHGDSQQTKDQTFLLVFVPGITLLTAFGFLFGSYSKKKKKEIRSARHFSDGDQRDVIAFVLESKGLDEEAQTIRERPKDVSYWAASDALCKKWLQGDDDSRIRKGIEASDLLIDYAAITDGSRRIILLNMSRLALAINDIDLAKRYLAAATADKDGVIEKRIKMDEAFHSIVK
jgi:hypothetical protein